jgi:hypothetical protein
MSRVETMAESVSHDLVGQDAPMPGMRKMEDTFSASNRFEQGCVSHGLLLTEQGFAGVRTTDFDLDPGSE